MGIVFMTMNQKIRAGFGFGLITLLLSSALVRSQWGIVQAMTWLSLGFVIGALTSFSKSRLVWLWLFGWWLGHQFDWQPGIFWLGGFSYWLVARWGKRWLTKLILGRLGLGVILVTFVLTTMIEGENIRMMLTQEPKAEAFNADGWLFLKTYYYVNRGMDYYQAFAQAYGEDGRNTGLPPDLWGFRSPVPFYFWSWATFGQAKLIYWWFVLMVLGVLTISFQIGQKIKPGLGNLIIPFLLMPYFVYPGTLHELMQLEWWGVLPLLVCLYGVLVDKPILIFLGGLLAPMMRETYALNVLGLGLTTLITKKTSLFRWFILVGGLYLVWLGGHAKAVFGILNPSWTLVMSGRSHPLGLGFIMITLAFSTWRYLGAPWRLLTVYLGLVGMLGLKQLWLFPNKAKVVIWMFGLFGINLLVYGVIGLYPWGDYWGVTIGPGIILALGVLINQNDKSFYLGDYSG